MSVLSEILARFGVEFDDKELKAGDKAVTGVTEKLKELGKWAIGAFAVHKVAEFTSEILEEADALGKAAGALGLNARELQELEHAAGLSGVGVEKLRSSLARLQKGAAEAAESAKGPVSEAYKKLGVDLKNQDGTLRSSADLFEDVAEGLSKIEDPTKAAGIAGALFGKSYAELLPLLREGREGIAKLRAEVEELGFGFDEEFIKDAEEFNDNLDRTKRGMRGLGMMIVGLALPYLRRFSEAAVDITKGVVKWTRESNVLQAGLAVLAVAGIMKASKALGPLGAALRVVGRSFMWLATRILLPVLILDDLITTFKGGDSVTRRFIDSLFGIGTTAKVVDDLKDSWRIFTDEVMPAAKEVAQEVADGLKLAWSDATAWIQEQTDALGAWLDEFWDGLPAPVQEALDSIGAMFTNLAEWAMTKIGEILSAINPLEAIFKKMDDRANQSARENRALEDIEARVGAAKTADVRMAKEQLKGGPLNKEQYAKLMAVANDLRASIPEEAVQAHGARQKGRQKAHAPVTPAHRGAGGTVNNVSAPTNVNVTVPPGTPGQTAAAVGRAAERGARTGARATMAAVTQGSG